MRTPKNLTGEAAEYFKRNAPLCAKMGTLTDADKDSFQLLCITWGRLAEAEKTGAGSIEWVCLLKQYQNQSKTFGLDPLSRKRLGIVEPTQEADEFGI